MPLLRRNAILCIEVEASEGVAETQLAADAILVYDPTPGPAIERHERTPIRASLSPMNRISGKRQMTISFGVEIKVQYLGEQ